MSAFDFFIEILSLSGQFLNKIVEMFMSFSPVYIILTVLIGIMIISIVFGIIRGRKM